MSTWNVTCLGKSFLPMNPLIVRYHSRLKVEAKYNAICAREERAGEDAEEMYMKTETEMS